MIFSFKERQITENRIWFKRVDIIDYNENVSTQILNEAEQILENNHLFYKSAKGTINHEDYKESYLTTKLDESEFAALVKYLMERNINITFKTEEQYEEKLVDKMLEVYREDIKKEVYLCVEVDTDRKYITVAKDTEQAYGLLKADYEDLGEVIFKSLTHGEDRIIQVM